jgi:sortase A
MNSKNVLGILTLIRKILSVIVIFASLFLITAPFFPKISFPVKNNLESLLKSNRIIDTSLKTKSLEKTIPEKNTLRITKINVESEIVEGDDEQSLNRGMWIRPNSSTPEKGGNTVITGHRFLYTFGSNTLYHLDKLENGDNISVFWNQKEYVYKVLEKKIVPPNEIQIEDQTSDPRLTIYTCTPIWTATDRLVIIAEPT